MLTKKEMGQVIKAWVKSLPGKEHNKSIITCVGSKYVTLVNLYDSSSFKVSIEDFYNNDIPYFWK